MERVQSLIAQHSFSAAFSVALQHNLLDALDLMLPHMPRPWSSAMLFQAINANNERFVLYLLARCGINADSTNKVGKPALFLALERPNIVMILLMHGANANATDGERETALHKALAGGHVDAIQLLITAGADPTMSNAYGVSALDVATERGLTHLLPATAIRGAAGTGSMSHLLHSILAQHSVAFSLIQHIATPESVRQRHEPDGMTPLATCVSSTRALVDTVQGLIDAGSELSFVTNDESRSTLAQLAIRGNRTVPIVRTLLAAGVAWQPRSIEPHESLLFTACAAGATEIVGFLISQGDCPWLEPDATPPSTRSSSERSLNLSLFTEEMLARLITALPGKDSSVVGTLASLVSSAGLKPLEHLNDVARHRLLCEAVRHAQPETVRWLLGFKTPIELSDENDELARNQLLSSRQGSSAIRIAIEQSYFTGSNYFRGRAATYTEILCTLIEAVRHSHPACVNTTSSERGSLLYHAATKLRSDKMVELLLQSGANVNHTGRLNHDGEPCGMLATVLLENQCWDSIAERLMRAGASVHALDRRGMSPLHHVCHSRLRIDLENRAIEHLIDAKADVDQVWHTSSLVNSSFSDDTEGLTPLMMAILNQGGNSYAVQRRNIDVLLRAKANVNCTGNSLNWTPLMVAASRHCSTLIGDVMLQLIDLGADISARMNGATHRSVLSFVLQFSATYPAVLARMLAIDPSYANMPVVDAGPEGTITTPLIMAVKYLSLEHVELLLKAGADVNGTSAQGYMAIGYATEQRDKLLCLLQHGACPNAIDSTTNRPLLNAAMSNAVAVSHLLQYRADANCRDPDTRNTPLHLAIQHSLSVERVKQLLDHGAVQATNAANATPLAVARSMQARVAIMALLWAPYECQCSICDERALVVPLSTCSHAFCDECLHGWLRSFMSSGIGGYAACPGTGCNRELSIEDVKRYLHDEQLFAQYDRRIAETCCNLMEDFSWCIRCSSGGTWWQLE